MILVDVYIPAVDQMYDFRVEEACFPDTIIGELCEMAEQKEQIVSGETERMVLIDASQQSMLPFDKTLEESGVEDGHLLILV